ncbi:MAG: class I SAM-dependent methyltransferase [Proteobacteria bacterium]|nr:class I SAM-dependent methyltransferase [Pseudomonadota bacterium]
MVSSTTPAVSRAAQVIQASGVHQGYALIVGSADADLAIELVRQSDLEVVLVEKEPALIQRLRQRLDEAGVYGVRATVMHSDAAQLPLGGLTANLIVVASGRPPEVSAAEVHRLLRPVGGAFLAEVPAGQSQAWARWVAGSPLADWSAVSKGAGDRGGLHRWVRGRLVGAGDWAHQYGGADNSSCSQDDLIRGDLQVAWWGDPGPRPMPDRGNRNPAPLSVNGRLMIQGDRILFGLDAYNGAILWSFSCPEIRRANG